MDGRRPFMARLAQKTLPVAGSYNWAKLEDVAGEMRIYDLPKLMEYFLYRTDPDFTDTVIRHLVLGEFDSEGRWQVFLGAPAKDIVHRTQENYEKAGRPHLLVRAGEGRTRHMQIHQEHFVAMAHYLGPHSSGQWWPSMGKERADGLVGINWLHKPSGQVLSDVAPPLK